MTDIERCQYGWQRMAEMFNYSDIRTVYAWKDELEGLGLIRYAVPGTGYKSSEGKRVRRKMVQWFPSDIKAWWRAQNKLDYEEKSLK